MERKAIFRHVVDSFRAEVECSACGQTFVVDRDEDGDAALPDHKCEAQEACTEDCEPDRCHDCGACPEHCDCEDGFVDCTCERTDVDQMDARYCRAHGRR